MNKLTHIKQSDRGVDDELSRIISTLNGLIDKIADPTTSTPEDVGKVGFQAVTLGNNEYCLSMRTKDGIINSIPGLFVKSDQVHKTNTPKFSYSATVAAVEELESSEKDITCSTLTVTSEDNDAITNSGGISSAVYSFQSQGYRITTNGNADFRYLYTDELHAKAFIADLEQALAGGQIICKSVAKLMNPFPLPVAGGTGTLTVEEFAGFSGNVFADGDMIRLRQMTRSGNTTVTVADAWGTVVFSRRRYWGNTLPLRMVQLYTFTRSADPNAGTATGTITEGTLALDYGTTGQGYYEVTAIDGANGANSPYAQCVTWTSHPASGCTVEARFGNLTGITSDTWGPLSGYGLYGDRVYLEGNCYIKGVLTIVSGTDGELAGLTISSTALTATGGGNSTIISSGATAFQCGPTLSPTFTVTKAGVLTCTSAVLKTAGSTKYIDIGNTIENEIQFFESSTAVVRIGSNVYSTTPGLEVISGSIYSHSSTTYPIWGAVIGGVGTGLYGVIGSSTGSSQGGAVYGYAHGAGVNSAITGRAEGGTTNNSFNGISGNIYNDGDCNITGTYQISGVALAASNIGATTVGSNIFTLTNPSAITFLRMNADNTASALAAADFRTALGLGTAALSASTSFAAAANGAAFAGAIASGFWVASESGGPTTAQLPVRAIVINGVTHYTLE
ncbi:MAG: hypothetical protein WC356_06500 [Candidatus Micrarchaeia archaeon]|jgi:hypothetical protein